MHALHLIKNQPVELVNARQADTQHIVLEILGAPVAGSIGRVLQAIAFVSAAADIGLHRPDGRPGVAGGVELRHHGNALGPGVAQDFLVFLLRIISIHANPAAGLRFETLRLLQVPVRELMMGAKGGKFRNLRDFQAPGLVVSQVEMKEVQLVGSHDVQQLQHLLRRAEIPHHIQHEAPQAQIRPVLDDHVPRSLRKLGQGDGGIAGSVFIGRFHGRLSLGIEGEPIPARRALFRRRRRGGLSGAYPLGDGDEVCGLYGIAFGKEGRVRLRSFPVAEGIAGSYRPVFTAFHLQYKALGSPGAAG